MRERLSVHAVRDADEILLDDRALVQIGRRKVRGRADELDAVVVGLVIWSSQRAPEMGSAHGLAPGLHGQRGTSDVSTHKAGCEVSAVDACSTYEHSVVHVDDINGLADTTAQNLHVAGLRGQPIGAVEYGP